MRKWFVWGGVVVGVAVLANYEYKWRFPFTYWLGAQVDKVLRFILP